MRKVGPQGYIADQYVAWFAGIAPIDDPRIVTVVVINDPKGEVYGGGAVLGTLDLLYTVVGGSTTTLNASQGYIYVFNVSN